MSVKDVMNRAKVQIESSFDLAIENENDGLGELLELISCYKARSGELGLNEQVDEIVYDLFSSIYLSLSGLYRQSYISLRCVLEMGISLMKFCDNRYSYLLWLDNSEDIQWSKLKDYDSGVLSSKYLKLFMPEGDMSLLIESINHYYRECSEYVHGKHKYLSPLRDFKIQYNEKLCNQNLIMCKNVIQSLVMLLIIRFGNKADDYYVICEDCKKRFEV